MAHGPSCSAARGIFPDQGSNPCPLRWQADSQPLRHQGSPIRRILTSQICPKIFDIGFKPSCLAHAKQESFFFFFFKLLAPLIIIYLFIWLCWVFVSVRGLPLAAASGGPLFIAVRGPLTIVASLVTEHRLQTRRLSSCGSRAQLLRGMWDPPRPELGPVSPALAGRLSTTAPPGKPFFLFLYCVCQAIFLWFAVFKFPPLIFVLHSNHYRKHITFPNI